MLLKIGGPFMGYYNGQVIEVDDEKGRALVEALGANSGRVEILGDLRGAAAAPAQAPEPPAPSRKEREAAEEEALLAEIREEEAAAIAATAKTDS